MNQKNNLVLLISLVCAIAVPARSQDPNIQAKIAETRKCSSVKFVMPSSIAVENQAFESFIGVAALPSGAKQKAFSNISSKEKSDFFKIRLSLILLKYPALTNDQKELVLDTIISTSSDQYNKSRPEIVDKARKKSKLLQERALALFAPRDAYEIFAGIYTSDEDLDLIRAYEALLSLPISSRKQRLRELSPKDKSRFWKAQMIYHLALSNLTRNQKEFIADSLKYLTPRTFDFAINNVLVKNEETNALDSLKPRAFEIFSKEEIFAIFMSNGIHKQSPSDSQRSNTVNSVWPGEATPDSSGVLLKPPTCDCVWWCGIGDFGCTNRVGCGATTDGCGWYGDESCTSICRP